MSSRKSEKARFDEIKRLLIQILVEKRGKISEPKSYQWFRLMGRFKENWTEERRPRVANFFYDHISGWEGLEGMKWAAEQLGFEHVGQEAVPMLGSIDTSVEWLRLAGKEADLIHCLVCGATAVTTFMDASGLEIQEKGITLLHSGYYIDDSADIVGEAAYGWYTAKWYPTPVEEDLPGMRTV